VDSIFSGVNRVDGPGCALGVYRAGTIVYANGYGLANLEHGVRITPQTDFYIASTSKQFTAASIALLAEAGRLDLNAPIRRWFPELPAYTDSVTVLDLVHHTSGIRDYLTLWGQAGKSFGDDISEDDALASIVRQKALDFRPGTRWSYSNSGYFLLSVLVRRVTGKSLRQFSDSAIFQPLGMTHTHFHDDRMMVVPNRAEGYEPKIGGGWAEHRTGYALVGDGGLHTTVEDLARWDANFYDNKLGKGGPAFIEAITTPGTLRGNRPMNYAFGLMREEYRGLPVVAHGGAFIGFRASLTRYPSRRLSVAILCNDYNVNPDLLVTKVADLYLAVPAKAVAAGPQLKKIEPARLAAYAGRYEVFPGMPVVLTARDSTLAAEFMGRAPAVMARRSDSSFAFPLGSIELAFPLNPAGPASELTVVTPTGADRVPRLAEPPSLSPVELQAYAGKYWSDELQVTYSIEVTSGKVLVNKPGSAAVELKLFAPDLFAANVGKLSFRRGTDGKVGGFRLSTSRSEGIEFIRVEK
jgi:CubicO group peptidase (beta-lactamase class C family)